MIRRTTFLLTLALLGTAAYGGDTGKKVVIPPEPERWEFLLAVPGWMPALEGDTGVNGLVSHVDLDPGDIIRRYDMVLSLRAEAGKGRFGIMGDLLYTSLSDGIGGDGLIRKVDLQVDQTIAELALRWRVIEGPRGFLDVLGGVRYTNLFQQVVTQANGERIEDLSTDLVDAVGDRVRDAIDDLDIRGMVADRLRTRIEGFDPKRPSQMPIGPLGGRLADRVRARIETMVRARVAELRERAAAVRTAVGAARVRAQARLNDFKKDISDDIARELESALGTRVARTDDWWDPIIGLRARYDLTERLYVTARGDIGGFGVGSDLTWQVEGALGWQLTPYIFAEAGYRAYGVDYDHNGLVYDVVMQGAQVTLGLQF